MRTSIHRWVGVVAATAIAFVAVATNGPLMPRFQDATPPAEPPAPAGASAAAPTDAPVNVAPSEDPPPPAVEPAEPDSFWDGWDFTLSAGINGSDGNSENFNVRAGAEAKRTTKDLETSLTLTYSYATDDGETSKHRAEVQGRNDWKLPDSPWGFFVRATGEYDEFQSWKYRASLFLGPSYRVIDDDRTMLRLRTGIGFTHEFGKQARNELIPELDLGLDFERKLTERQKVFVNFDYFPSLKDFSEFRTELKAGWDIVIDPEVDLSLKLGVNHRHNSEPGDDKKENDLEYFAMIGWSF